MAAISGDTDSDDRIQDIGQCTRFLSPARSTTTTAGTSCWHAWRRKTAAKRCTRMVRRILGGILRALLNLEGRWSAMLKGKWNVEIKDPWWSSWENGLSFGRVVDWHGDKVWMRPNDAKIDGNGMFRCLLSLEFYIQALLLIISVEVWGIVLSFNFSEPTPPRP